MFATSALPGSITNDSAAAGYIGEIITGTLASGSAISLTTATPANVISISLTPGDWDVTGVAAFHGSGTTVLTDAKQGISTTSATVGALGTFTYNMVNMTVAATDDATHVTPVVRVSLAATTTVYLVVSADFTTSTLTAYGFIRARRVR